MTFSKHRQPKFCVIFMKQLLVVRSIIYYIMWISSYLLPSQLFITHWEMKHIFISEDWWTKIEKGTDSYNTPFLDTLSRTSPFPLRGYIWASSLRVSIPFICIIWFKVIWDGRRYHSYSTYCDIFDHLHRGWMRLCLQKQCMVGESYYYPQSMDIITTCWCCNKTLWTLVLTPACCNNAYSMDCGQ